MPLEAGTRLGAYEIVAVLGAGGMGVVYKAKDTRLNRSVALKVLAEHVTPDEDATLRFEREARAISQLNHPHICTLYDVGRQDATDFLVMEYLEGPTLAERLQRGALPLDQALAYGVQIADALDNAHRHGVVHRDLKPGNIMLTKAGAKLLDFGLAKLRSAHATAESGVTASTTLTDTGQFLGTLPYMAPEQLEGRDADARTDVFAMGAVLYEMLTGNKAFEGDSRASLIAAIMHVEPPAPSSLRPAVPHLLDHLVKTCLAKDPDQRWNSAGDLGRQLQWVAASRPGVVATRQRRPARFLVAAAVGLVLFAAAALFLAAPAPGTWTRLFRRGATSAVDSPRSQRYSIALPDGAGYAGGGAGLALAPDGSRLVYVAVVRDQRSELFSRSMDELDARPIPGTQGASAPFFSADGRWIAFFTPPAGIDGYGTLKKIPLEGGMAQTVAEAVTIPGGAWTPDNYLVFTGRGFGLYRVAAAGGTPEPLTSPNLGAQEFQHVWPQALPDGKGILFTVGRQGAPASAAVLAPGAGGYRLLSDVSAVARYSPSGHLLVPQAGMLTAIRFDLDRLSTIGRPFSVLEGLKTYVTPGFVQASFDVADTGLLVYASGGAIGTTETTQGAGLFWVDGQGRREALPLAPRRYFFPRVSPDGDRIAVSIVGGLEKSDIWVFDIRTGRGLRLTNGHNDRLPLWTSDGRHIVFNSDRDTVRPKQFAGPNQWFGNLHLVAADGSGAVERIAASPDVQAGSGITPSGMLVYTHMLDRDTGWSVWEIPLDRSRAARPLLTGPFRYLNGIPSPDGRRLAFRSDESGDFEIYVKDYSAEGGRVPVSVGGGTWPVWSRDGRELYYSIGNRLMGVAIDARDRLAASPPREVLRWPYGNPSPNTGRNYDVAPDGRFLVPGPMPGPDSTKPAEVKEAIGSTSLVVVPNWTEELKRLVPTR